MILDQGRHHFIRCPGLDKPRCGRWLMLIYYRLATINCGDIGQARYKLLRRGLALRPDRLMGSRAVMRSGARDREGRRPGAARRSIGERILKLSPSLPPALCRNLFGKPRCVGHCASKPGRLIQTHAPHYRARSIEGLRPAKQEVTVLVTNVRKGLTAGRTVYDGKLLWNPGNDQIVQRILVAIGNNS